MAFFSFGEYKDDIPYKVLDERKMRGSAGIMFLMGIVAFINAFVLQQYIVITWVSGILMVNFIIGIFINPKFAPTHVIASLFTWKQSPLPIGAIQKKFAWSLGLGLSITIFTLSFFLLEDVSYFEPVCTLCLICLFLLFLETSMGICVGCKLYYVALWMRILPKPKVRPNCAGAACEV